MDDAGALGRTDFKFRFGVFQLAKTQVDEIDFDVRVTNEYGREYEHVSDEFIYMKYYHLIERRIWISLQKLTTIGC